MPRLRSRHALALAFAALSPCILSACPSRSVSSVPIDPDVVQRTNLELDDNRDIDILFVIDNSGSMENEQDSLAVNFPAIIDALSAGDNGLPNLHLGVITTDISGGELCPGGGDDGLLQVGADDCNAINDGSSFISDIGNDDDTRTTNYDGDLRDAFSCMAKVGTGGCGFEAPLEAIKRAIDNPANASFFRKSAYLAIVVISDEDDCSVVGPDMLEDTGDTTPAVLDSPLGPSSSFRCFEYGVVCDGPSDPREPGARTNCRPRSQSPFMNDVAPYIEHVRGTKDFPTLVFVAGIAGDLGPVSVEMGPANAYPFDIPTLSYSCEDTGLGEAVPPIRLDAFLNGFEQNTLTTLCQDDLTGAIAEIAGFIGGITGPPCLVGNVADTSDEPGLQPECTIVEVVNPGLESEVETVLHPCDNPADPPSSGNIPCYRMYEDPANCSSHPSGLAVDVIHPPGHVVPPATRAEVSCVSGS